MGERRDDGDLAISLTGDRQKRPPYPPDPWEFVQAEEGQRRQSTAEALAVDATGDGTRTPKKQIGLVLAPVDKSLP